MKRAWGVLIAAGGLAFGSAAFAQDAGEIDVHPPASVEVTQDIDSGMLRHSGRTRVAERVWSRVVRADGAAWMRLWFGGTTLSGDPAADGAFVRISSLLDGAGQDLNAEQLSRWQNSSAYFNGDGVLVEVFAYPGKGASRVRIERATVGRAESTASTRTICGGVDDRVLSSDPRCARLMPIGCTAWLIDDANHQFLTAGHCGPSTTSVIEFNVPLSSASGTVVHPSPDQQYPINAASVQSNGGLGVGNDYSYFGCAPNTTTGLTAYQAQGANFVLAPNVAPVATAQPVRIVGYGTTSSPISSTWNQVQKTNTGPLATVTTTALNYGTDTTGGNSGSPVEDVVQGLAIGIHTHGGCISTGGLNHGTSLHLATLRTALEAPRGVCLSGNGAVQPSLYVSPDLNNSFGTVSTSTGVFGAVARFGVPLQGLTFEPQTRRFYGVGASTAGAMATNSLYVIDPDTGARQRLGAIGGVTTTLNGLGFDPGTRSLYAIAQATGRLYRVDVETLAATAIGTALGGTIGGLEFDAATGQLFGIDDQGAGSRLVRIDPAAPVVQVVGALGAGITDCNGLAIDPRDGVLYTINATSGALLRLDRTTGVATVVGPTQGVFGSGYGMAFAVTTTFCPSDVTGDGAVTIDDLTRFLAWFEAGDLRADLDDGSGTLRRDAGVTIEDLIAFLAAFEMGC